MSLSSSPLHTDFLLKVCMLSLTFLILAMVMVGGLTRLTGSGLSIVEWKPVTGIFPPCSLQAWMHEFAKYQATPEFQKINTGMSLADFQSIFWLEYFHRLGGRLLGGILLIPSLLVAFKKAYRSLVPWISLLWILGAAQGVMGWLMVKSGLTHDPFVSPYRLGAHLLLGFAIFGASLWVTLMLYTFPRLSFPFLRKYLVLAMGLILFTAFLGALVAGFKAGLLYPTFPLMGGHLIPPEVFENLLDPASFQFFHRLFAGITLLYCLYLSLSHRGTSLRFPLTVIGGAALIQVSLGVATLLGGVPLILAVLHQGFAFVLFGSVLYTLFLIREN